MIEPALLFGGRYELGPVIGRGGMAEVRSGRDNRLDRPVAIKVMRAEVAHQPGVRSRFESEARLAARLIHPNVVAVFDSGEADGVPFIVMERLPGETLHDRMAAGPLPDGEVRAMAGQVLSALQAAHEAGVLHRDIKPGNVLAAGPGRWKVGDFGIAKALELGQSDLTATGLLIGTPAYLAPERFFGSPATVASDLYALGVVLYEALAGRKPFETDRADTWAALVSGAAAPPLASLRPGVDPALAAAIDRCLAKDPAERFWSAAEMAAVLENRSHPAAGAPVTTEAAPTAVIPVGGPGPGATAVLPLTDRMRRSGRSWGSGRRARALAAAGAVLVLMVVGIIAFSGGSHGSQSPPPSTPPSTTAATTVSGQTLPPGLDRALQNLEQQVTAGR